MPCKPSIRRRPRPGQAARIAALEQKVAEQDRQLAELKQQVTALIAQRDGPKTHIVTEPATLRPSQLLKSAVTTIPTASGQGRHARDWQAIYQLVRGSLIEYLRIQGIPARRAEAPKLLALTRAWVRVFVPAPRKLPHPATLKQHIIRRAIEAIEAQNLSIAKK